jgi:hypothetical protein
VNGDLSFIERPMFMQEANAPLIADAVMNKYRGKNREGSLKFISRFTLYVGILDTG